MRRYRWSVEKVGSRKMEMRCFRSAEEVRWIAKSPSAREKRTVKE